MLENVTLTPPSDEAREREQYGMYPLAIGRLAAFPIRSCAWTGLPLGTSWVVCVGHRAASREAVQQGLLRAGSTDGLLELLDQLNTELSDIDGDNVNVGVVDIAHPRVRDSQACSSSFHDYGETVPPLGRGRFDLAVGIGPAHIVGRLGHYQAHARAPRLAAFFDAKYGTPAPQRLWTPAEKRQRLLEEQRATAAAGQAAREWEALGQVAAVLFGGDSDELRERARGTIVAIDRFRAVVAAAPRA